MKVLDQRITEQYSLYHGDCIRVLEGIPDSSIHLTISSPPFSNLFIYSDSIADLGNSGDDAEFFEHLRFLVPHLYRVTVPGRLCAIHCKQLVNYKGRDGMAGLRDFRGDIIRAFTAVGWAYHSEVCIWTDPVMEMKKTKAHGLLWKQLRADSSFSRQGLPEYLLLFRRWPKSEHEESLIEPVTHTKATFPLELWQRYASPVWFDIDRTRVLNVKAARGERDSKHICPFELQIPERAIELWSNPGDVVYDPFAGVGTTLVEAVRARRRGLGTELKREYFETALRYIQQAIEESAQRTLFDMQEVAG